MWRLLAICIAALAIQSCGSTKNWVDLNAEPDIDAPPFRVTGSVKYVDIEGGIFAIQSSDGTQYNPVNLPDSFKTDGMAVEADARVRTDLVSGAMVGPMIELLRIRRL